RAVRYEADAARAVLNLDIAAAYPPESGIVSWERRLTLERGKRVIVEDAYALKEAGGSIDLSFMSRRRPGEAAAGRIDLVPDEGAPDGPLKLLFDGRAFKAKIETIEIKDERLRGSWGDRVYRIVLSGNARAKTGTIKVRLE
ncbi:MAG TPA: hypothetical protein VLJ16_09055, partial [Acidobacteriota bacterium]|nr:hypothetical protein [Acidobacteriota bacterium]